MELSRANTLVRIRTIEHDIALAAWGQARMARVAAEQERDTWIQKLHDWAFELRSKNALEAGKLKERLGQISHARKMLERREEGIVEALLFEDVQFSSWQQAKQRQEGVSRLRDRVETELRAIELHTEQTLVDDITSTRHQRKGPR